MVAAVVEVVVDVVVKVLVEVASAAAAAMTSSIATTTTATMKKKRGLRVRSPNLEVVQCASVTARANAEDHQEEEEEEEEERGVISWVRKPTLGRLALMVLSGMMMRWRQRQRRLLLRGDTRIFWW
jgi:hypothetical protein